MTKTTNKFMKYVSLNVIGMIGLSCYILADTFFVAVGVGLSGLAALNLAIPLYSFIYGLGLMLGMGGATRFSISKTKSIFTQVLYIWGLLSFLFVILGLFFSDNIALILGSDKDTFTNVNIYLKIIFLFAPMFMLNSVFICFIRNDNNPKIAMTAMLTGSISNIILDYIFIFPLKMGMFGAAIATGIAPIISLIILSSHVIKKKNNFFVIKVKPHIKSFIDIFSLGLSTLVTELSMGIVIIVLNFILLNLEGNVGVAAYGVIANIALVVMAVYTGIGQGMQPLISASFREDDKNSIKLIFKYGFICVVCVSVLIYLFSFVFAKNIVNIFNKEDNVLLEQIATNGIKIYFLGFVFAGINILYAVYFSAIDNPKTSFIISILRGFIIIIPASFLLSAMIGINGVWIAMPLTEIIVLIISLIFEGDVFKWMKKL